MANTHVDDVRLIETVTDSLAFFIRNSPRFRPGFAHQSVIFGVFVLGPLGVRARSNAQHLAGLDHARTARYGFLDQLNGFGAILGVDQLAVPPQILRAFFDSTSNDAVSASAFSFRSSSLS